jgi:hypothetical protein
LRYPTREQRDTLQSWLNFRAAVLRRAERLLSEPAQPPA